MHYINILNNKSKVICLNIIHRHLEPIHLRRIVNFSSLQPRSVQLALASLKKSKIILSRKNKNRIEYYLNKNYQNLNQLLMISNDLTKAYDQNKNEYSQVFHNSIKFIIETKDLISQLKSNNVVN